MSTYVHVRVRGVHTHTFMQQFLRFQAVPTYMSTPRLFEFVASIAQTSGGSYGLGFGYKYVNPLHVTKQCVDVAELTPLHQQAWRIKNESAALRRGCRLTGLQAHEALKREVDRSFK